MLYGSAAYGSLPFGSLPTTRAISQRAKGPATVLFTSSMRRTMLRTTKDRTTLVTNKYFTAVV